MRHFKRLLKVLLRWIPVLLKYAAGYFSLHLFHRELLKKEIWLISEKRGEARDNGYHLFKFIRTNHPEINAYFVITPDAKDREKVLPYGNLIDHDSKEHMLYYLAAKYSINSQSCGAYPYEMIPEIFRFTRIFRNPKQKCVFLQHGIIKDAMPDKKMFHKSNIHDLFVASAKRERDFIISEYGYPENYVVQAGLCRFDNLTQSSSAKEKTVLVMPTWRSWLQVRNGSNEERQVFFDSEYCQTYISLLKNKELYGLLEQYDYRLVFYPHYGVQKYLDCFADCANERVIIASKEKYDVQDLLIRSGILITDFSSVYFDFAYMGKPVVYYQFDEEKFFDGHYQKGYFSYRKDGFGKVVREESELLDELKLIIDRGCTMDVEYKKRREDFFDLIDSKNCERNFNAILSLEERNG